MMNIYISFITVISIIMATSTFAAELSRFRRAPVEVCGRNQIWTDCGVACPDRCIKFPKKVCPIENYVRGCDCKPGYVLDPNVECVLPSECPGGRIYLASEVEKIRDKMAEMIKLRYSLL